MPTFGDLSQYKQKSNTYTVPSYVAQQKYSLTDLRKDEHIAFDDKLIEKLNHYKGTYVRAPKMSS